MWQHSWAWKALLINISMQHYKGTSLWSVAWYFTHSYWDSENEAVTEAQRLIKMQDDGSMKALRIECPMPNECGSKYYFKVLKFNNWCQT